MKPFYLDILSKQIPLLFLHETKYLPLVSCGQQDGGVWCETDGGTENPILPHRHTQTDNTSVS